MQVRCLACGRWLFEVTEPGQAKLRVRCTKCKQSWEVRLQNSRIQLDKILAEPTPGPNTTPTVPVATEK